MAESGLVLINLANQDAFTFRFFPESVRTTDRVNWEAQETTIGIKPLFYGNREPREIEFEELWFDSTDTNESLTTELKSLKALLDELEETGRPPILLAAWGDRHERCVITDLSIEEVFFHDDGHPMRAKVSLSLLQLEAEKRIGTSTVEILEDPPDTTVGRPRQSIDERIYSDLPPGAGR